MAHTAPIRDEANRTRGADRPRPGDNCHQTLERKAGAYLARQVFEPGTRVELMKLEGSTALAH
jgi:hypothetical protein